MLTPDFDIIPLTTIKKKPPVLFKPNHAQVCNQYEQNTGPIEDTTTGNGAQAPDTLHKHALLRLAPVQTVHCMFVYQNQ